MATTFIPLSLDKQLEEADGVVLGEFKGLEYRKINDGRILTEATFKIIKSAGIKQSEIVNKNNFKVVYPGGEWQGLVYKVSGAPKFFKDEKSLLILKNTPYGYSVKGLGMGKYEIYKEFDKTYYKSAVFPGHAKLGKISSKTLNNSLEKMLGESLVTKSSDLFVFKSNTTKKVKSEGRAPASVGNSRTVAEQLDKKEEEASNPYWLVILFAFMGAYSAFSMRKHRK